MSVRRLSESKRCPQCCQYLPLVEFGPNRSNPDGLSRWCRPCKRASDRMSYRRRRALDPELVSWQATKQKYGLTPEDFHSLLASQGGNCSICDSELSERRRTCVDHHHETGMVRGLLCFYCNTTVGRWETLSPDQRKRFLAHVR